MNKNLTFNFYLSYFLKGWKRMLFRDYPIFLTFFITSKCNACCEHCFYWHRLNKVSDELSLEEIEKISKSIHPFPKLLLSGGEPFLREDVDEICKIFYLNNKVKQITIPTNGILTEIIHGKISNILKFCKNEHVQVQLSIDGIGGLHDRIRKTDKAFDKLMQTYYSLRTLEEKYKNFEINFCLTFSSLNQNNIKDTYDYLVSKGNSNFSILLTREPVRDKALLKFDFEKYVRWNKYIVQNKFLRNKNLSERISVIRNHYQMKTIERVVKNEGFKFKCTAGILTAVIDETGFVYPCENCKLPFGSLRKESYNFERIWLGKSANDFRRRLSLNKCRCTHESNIMTNISFSPYLYLAFLIKSLRLNPI